MSQKKAIGYLISFDENLHLSDMVSEAYYAPLRNLKGYIDARESEDTIRKKKKDHAEAILTKLQKQDIGIKKNSSAKKTAIGLLTGLAVTGVALFLVYRKKHRKKTQHFPVEEDEKHPGLTKNEDAVVGPEDDKSNESSVSESLNIPEETVHQILKKLTNFEKSLKYIRNNLSSSYLATFCETNTKYLSHILNTYKGKDYHAYINDLRINYIIHKLKNDPQYRKYKIAVLAGEAGFSSHTKFSSIFKKYTSFTPSMFIKYLEQEEEI